MRQTLIDENTPVYEAVQKVVHFYFEYLNNNPTYINLIIWENLNKGMYMEDLEISCIKQPALIILKSIIECGKNEGSVKIKIDAVQIIITLLESTFAHFSNRHTLSKLLQSDLMVNESIEMQAKDLTKMILSYIRN